MRRFYTVLMLATSFLLAFHGCAQEEDVNEIPEKGEIVMTSLSFTGDIDVSQEPLTKAGSSNDIYGINVYYDENNNGYYVSYAHGLFDDVQAMQIPLLSGYKYSFECSLIKNAKNVLYNGPAYGQTYPGYCLPFILDKKPTVLENKFIMGTGSLVDLNCGNAHLAGKVPGFDHYNGYKGYTNSDPMPNVDRYYGEIYDYLPQKNGNVVIPMKRSVFGAKFVITGIGPDGTLKASVSTEQTRRGVGKVTLWEGNFKSDDPGSEKLYSFSDLADLYKKEKEGAPYALKATVSATYKTDRGETWTWTKDVQFKRNYMTTVNINVHVDHYKYMGDISLIEETLGDDNVIDLEINGDGIIDTPVTPVQ